MKAPALRGRFPARLLLLLSLAATGWAQSAVADPDTKTEPAATVTFTLDWPAQKPPRYSITAESTGHATLSVVDDPDDPAALYARDFTLSGAACRRIFAAARALDYFHGDFDFTKHQIAFTGRKTLAYEDPLRRSQTSYNWSENAELMDLTRLFQAIENTLDHGRKLEFLRRFDRLGLNGELQAMEELARDGYLAEVHTIAPLLRQIADDPRVMDLARQRARRLLLLVSADSPPSPPGR